MITYIIYDSLSKLCKIGKTKDIKKRLSTLSTSNLNLHLLFTLNHIKEAELHRMFKDKRVKKEWFNLTLEDLKGIDELEDENKINFLF